MKTNPLNSVPALLLRSACFVAIIFGLTATRTSFSPAPDIFVGASPCDLSVRPFLSIPAGTNCEVIKWRLSLFRNPESETLSRFTLNYTYGMAKAGTQGFINDGTQAEIQGRWSYKKNESKLPGKFLLLLQPTKGIPLTFLKLDNNLLHLMDNEGKLMIGNAAWSYTLNRTKNQE